MNPQKGQYVKLMFNGGQSAEGFVDSWSDDKSILINRERTSMLIIQRTKESVLFVKIITQTQTQSVPKSELLEAFEEIANQPKRSREDVKNLADLRIELNRQEREDLANAVKSHELGQITPVNYAIPKFASQPSPLQHSGTKGPRVRVPAYSGVPPMFQNKNKDK